MDREKRIYLAEIAEALKPVRDNFRRKKDFLRIKSDVSDLRDIYDGLVKRLDPSNWNYGELSSERKDYYSHIFDGEGCLEFLETSLQREDSSGDNLHGRIETARNHFSEAEEALDEIEKESCGV